MSKVIIRGLVVTFLAVVFAIGTIPSHAYSTDEQAANQAAHVETLVEYVRVPVASVQQQLLAAKCFEIHTSNHIGYVQSGKEHKKSIEALTTNDETKHLFKVCEKVWRVMDKAQQ